MQWYDGAGWCYSIWVLTHLRCTTQSQSELSKGLNRRTVERFSYLISIDFCIKHKFKFCAELVEATVNRQEIFMTRQTENMSSCSRKDLHFIPHWYEAESAKLSCPETVCSELFKCWSVIQSDLWQKSWIAQKKMFVWPVNRVNLNLTGRLSWFTKFVFILVLINDRRRSLTQVSDWLLVRLNSKYKTCAHWYINNHKLLGTFCLRQILNLEGNLQNLFAGKAI